MNPVFRGLIVFVVLWAVFRIAGRRTLAEITTFDFLLILVVGDLTQQALIGDDFSITTMALVVVTLLVCNIGMDRLSISSKKAGRVLESVPVVVVENGKALEHQLKAEGVDVEEVLAAAREHGLKRLDEIQYAIVERHGGISIVPAKDAK